MHNELPLLISFSGGRTSAFMAKYLIERYPNREKAVVFSNTGKEREETLQFVDECDRRWNLNVVWIEAKVTDQHGIGTSFEIVDYHKANRSGDPFEQLIQKFGIPNLPYPHCSRELKRVPIRKYMQSLGYKKWETAIGIRYDEQHRINWHRAAKDRYIYPLATDMKATKDFIRSWWLKQDFDLGLKDYEGNCDMCWKKSERKLLTLIVERPDLIEWWKNMEDKYGDGRHTFFRNGRSANDLIEASKKSFTMVQDQWEVDSQQTVMFDPLLDIEYDCFCKTS